MRTIIELPEDQVRELALACAREGISRAEAIRRAVALYLASQAEPAAGETAFGVWKGLETDGLGYEDRVRQEWAVAERRPRYKRPR